MCNSLLVLVGETQMVCDVIVDLVIREIEETKVEQEKIGHRLLE